MSAELVEIVDARASIEAMPQDAREMLIAANLEQADSWLRAALAVPSPDPRSIADYKVQIAAVEQMARQLRLSKDTQLHATELVRRAERGVGVAIRKGQAEGTVATLGENLGPRSDYLRGGRVVRAGRDLVAESSKVSPKAILPHGHDMADTYAMTDGVTDEQFDAAIDASSSIVRSSIGLLQFSGSGADCFFRTRQRMLLTANISRHPHPLRTNPVQHRSCEVGEGEGFLRNVISDTIPVLIAISETS